MMQAVFLPLVTGLFLGLSVAVPFGPIALLCVQRSIATGAKLGIATGLGAASVQVIYATAAIAGAGAIAANLGQHGASVRLASGALLVALGSRLLIRRQLSVQAPGPMRAHRAFASSFALAFCNPLTVMPYLLVASAAATTEGGSAGLTLWSVPGVFVGAASWYAVISGGAAWFGSGLPPSAIRILNRAAGTVLIGFGLLSLCR